MLSKRMIPMVALLASAAAACVDDGTSPDGGARLQVLITDAPSDYVETAEVWISRVYLVPGEGGENGAGHVDLFNDADNPKQYDLLTLRDGLTADLTDPVEVEAGVFNQLRLVVDLAEISLKDGFEFSDGTTSRSLFVPSGMQSGIKVQLDGPLTPESGQLTVVTVDFDVDQNFVLQGNPDSPAGLRGILFTPVLREKDRVEQENGQEP